MAPNNQTKVVLYAILKFLLATVSSVFQLHFLLFSNILKQHQTLQEEVATATRKKNYAMQRYNRLRNRYLRKKRRHWINPGRTLCVGGQVLL